MVFWSLFKYLGDHCLCSTWWRYDDHVGAMRVISLWINIEAWEWMESLLRWNVSDKN